MDILSLVFMVAMAVNSGSASVGATSPPQQSVTGPETPAPPPDPPPTTDARAFIVDLG